jgi:hypothetical protein
MQTPELMGGNSQKLRKIFRGEYQRMIHVDLNPISSTNPTNPLQNTFQLTRGDASFPRRTPTPINVETQRGVAT